MSDFSISVYERPGSPFWWARCYLAGEGGKERRWSTGVRIDAEGGKRQSRRAGEEAARRRAGEIAAEANAAAALAADTSLSEVLARLLNQKVADGKRPRTVHSIAHLGEKHVLPFFGAARDIRTIRRADLEAFKRSLAEAGYQPVTVNNCLTVVRQALKYAHSIDESIESVPDVANVRVSSEGKGRALAVEEVSKLLESVDSRAVEARQYLAFIANTGMRKTETLAMRWGWIDWERAELRVPAEFRKGAQARAVPVPLNAAALAILADRRDHGTKYIGSRKVPLPTGPGDRVWLQVKHDAARNAAAERAGIGRVRTHDLRHTRGSLLHAAGASLPEVRDVLGHKTLAMVSRYAHSYSDRLHAVADRVQVADPSVRINVPGEQSKTPANDEKCTTPEETGGKKAE